MPPKKNSFADAMFAELAAVSRASKQPVTQAQIDAGVRSIASKAKAPSLDRKRHRFANAPRPSNRGSLSASPKGTLTQQATDWLGGALGGTRRSQEVAQKFGDLSNFINPASWATNTGHALAEFKNGPSVDSGVDAAFGLLDIPTGGKASLLAHAALPGIKKGAKKVLASAEDFLPQNLQNLHKKDGWSVFTAENPMGKQATPEDNARAMAALKADLDGEGIQYIDGGIGKYDNNENVLAAHGITEEQARRFGKKHNQESVLTRKGLLMHDGSVVPSKGVNVFDEAPENYFTELPNGSKFSLDLDFDNVKPAPRSHVLSEYMGGGDINTNSLHSPYSPVKMRKTHAEQNAEFEQTHQFSESPVMRPEDFKVGSHIVPLVGDRTATGRSLVSIDGRPLSEPLPLEGGARYPHFQADNGHDAAWASHNSVTTAIANNVQKMAANGEDVHGVYSAMGPTSGDFSTMMSDALMRQLNDAPISKGALSGFDAQIRKDFPRFAGISDPERADELRQQLLKKGSLRREFVKAMDDAQRQAAGFPDVAATRYAITDPTLRNVPAGTSGLTVAKMDTVNRPTNDAAIPHTSYPSQVKGAFSGGFEVPLSREEVFPDFFNGRRATGVGTGGDRRSFEISSVNQPVTQHWIDSVSEAIERKKANGLRW